MIVELLTRYELVAMAAKQGGDQVVIVYDNGDLVFVPADEFDRNWGWVIRDGMEYRRIPADVIQAWADCLGQAQAQMAACLPV